MKSNLFAFICLSTLFAPRLVFGDPIPGFESLVTIPGVTDVGNLTLNAYFNAVYRLAISIGALIAVVKIIGAGAKYMLTDIVPTKGAALADIKGALLGLLVIIVAVLILGTINKNILNTNLSFEIFKPIPPPDITTAITSADEFCTTYNETAPDACVVKTCGSILNSQEAQAGMLGDIPANCPTNVYINASQPCIDACSTICKSPTLGGGFQNITIGGGRSGGRTSSVCGTPTDKLYDIEVAGLQAIADSHCAADDNTSCRAYFCEGSDTSPVIPGYYNGVLFKSCQRSCEEQHGTYIAGGGDVCVFKPDSGYFVPVVFDSDVLSANGYEYGSGLNSLDSVTITSINSEEAANNMVNITRTEHSAWDGKPYALTEYVSCDMIYPPICQNL